MLGFSKQAYFEGRTNPVSDRGWDDAHLINAAITIRHDHCEFGCRFIAHEDADGGLPAGRNRVNLILGQRSCGQTTPASGAQAALLARRRKTTWT